MTVHLASVKNVLSAYSIEVAAEERDDLKEDPIVKRLRKVRDLPWCDACEISYHLRSDKAGGASYDGI
jgi:hypothetical protein